MIGRSEKSPNMARSDSRKKRLELSVNRLATPKLSLVPVSRINMKDSENKSVDSTDKK